MNKEATDFINHISAFTVKACEGTKLFPSLMLAQACLESNYGQSKLSSLHNNYFGIKASTGWKGDIIAYNTTEYINKRASVVKQTFRKYPTLEAGFADRVRFLQVNPRYTKYGVFSSATPREQAQAFLRAGYATDPLYAEKLIRLIDRYNLTKYDVSCKAL